jgi:flagellar basal-body rod modification protein FlgD
MAEIRGDCLERETGQEIRRRTSESKSRRDKASIRQGKEEETMAAIAGLMSNALTAGQALSGSDATSQTNAASDTSSTSSTSTNSATISANDFLTLLVTEMQNQDPTADTDPNEYINQLVSVNSLEQLIDINQTLTTDSSASTASGSGTTASSAASSLTAAHSSAAGTASSQAAGRSSTPELAPGNLSVPATNLSAQRVGHALDGRSHMQSIAGGSFGAQ